MTQSTYGPSNFPYKLQRMEEKEREKERFFEGLYELDERDDSEEINTAALILRKSRKYEAETIVAKAPDARGDIIRRAPTNSPAHTHITRTVSAPLPLIDSPICRKVECVKDSPAIIASAVPDRQRKNGSPRLPIQNLRRTTDGGTVITKDNIKMSAKRKREKPVQVLPESRQIFRGLQFCTTLLSRHEVVLTDCSLRAQQRCCTGSENEDQQSSRVWGPLGPILARGCYPCHR